MVSADKRSSGGGVALLVLATLLISYPLSSGPAACLVSQSGFNLAAWETLYAPLMLAGERSEFIRDKTEWYVGLWDSEVELSLVINRILMDSSWR